MEYIPVKSDIGEMVKVTIIKTGGKVKDIVMGLLIDVKNNRYYVLTEYGKRWYKYVTIRKED